VDHTKKHPLLSAQQALKIITTIPIPAANAIQSGLLDALTHVLAEEITTPRDIPPFNRAAMDGYAVRSADVQKPPVTLQVVDILEAGQNKKISLDSGQCVKIMTGAAVPADADAVVMIENTQTKNPTKHTIILKSVKPFENIAHRGEDAPAGSTILPAGQLLTAQALATAAGAGYNKLNVYPKPTIAFLQTGGELIEPGHPVEENQIYNSNSTLLAGLIQENQLGKPNYLGICPDNREKLTQAIQTGLKNDCLLLTGGVSKGDFDYVPEILQNCGVKIEFAGLAIKPGKPLLFGSAPNGSFVFGLPGNPVSVLVCFYEFVAPLLRRLARQKDILPPETHATITAPIQKKTGRQFYCSAKIEYQNNQFIAHPAAGSGSGDYISAADTNGVLILPADSGGAQAGDTLTAHLWQWPLERQT
jgi:molybdopterin molybdotransferase